MKDEYEAILAGIIGRQIQVVYSDGFMYTRGDEFLESKNVFLSIQGIGYVNLRSYWYESEEKKDDIFKFDLSLIDQLKQEQMASVFSFFDAQKISEIAVYSELEDNKENCISCDYAIVIEREDSKKVCFTGGESAFRNIRMYSDDQAIYRLLSKKGLISKRL